MFLREPALGPCCFKFTLYGLAGGLKRRAANPMARSRGID